MYEIPIKALAHFWSRGSQGSRLCVLTYHGVFPQHDPLRPSEPTAASFDAQLRVLRKSFTILRLDKAVELLREQRLPRRALAITFDDGYKNNLDIALPILKRHGVAATFFIATGFMQGGAMFNDIVIEAVRHSPCGSLDAPWTEQKVFALDSLVAKRQAIDALLPQIKKLPIDVRNERVEELTRTLRAPKLESLMMTPQEVQALHRAGMEIGGHTVNHPILLSLDDDAALTEIASGKHTLESILQTPIKGFAYPNGRPSRDYDQRHTLMVQRVGFEYAVSTRWATADISTPILELPRVAPGASSPTMFALRVARAYRD